MAIDLTGSDAAVASAAAAAAAASKRRRSMTGFTLDLGADDDASSSPPASPGPDSQDARFANFTPVRRRPTPASRRQEPAPAAGAAAREVQVAGGSSRGGGSSRAAAARAGGQAVAIDLSSDNEQGGGEDSLSAQAVDASAAEAAKGAARASSQKNVGDQIKPDRRGVGTFFFFSVSSYSRRTTLVRATAHYPTRDHARFDMSPTNCPAMSVSSCAPHM